MILFSGAMSTKIDFQPYQQATVTLAYDDKPPTDTKNNEWI